MRMIALLFLVVAMVSASVFAEPVALPTAVTVARNWYASIQPSEMSVRRNVEVQDTFALSEHGAIVLYLFNMKDGGFVVVAGDDLSVPILGYSKTGHFDASNEPAGVKALFGAYEKQIGLGRMKNAPTGPKSRSQWNALSIPLDKVALNKFRTTFAGTKDAGPLLKTHWGQGWPYNKMCPPDPTGQGGHAAVGCVATALAQIMNYHQYPQSGFGSYGYSHPKYGTISADFGAQAYRWTDMPEYVNDGSPMDQQDAVSLLMFHCGVIVNMDYGTDGSGAFITSVPISLFQFFDYSVPTLLNSTTTTIERFNELLKNDLDKNKPVYFAATDPTSGARHAMVFDGYAAGDFVHVNFGWDGASDGYYYFSNINPSIPFSQDFEAIVDISPGVGINVRENTTWTGHRMVNQRIGICGEATLTIAPGATVEFGRFGGLTVFGSLQAVGTSEQPILFTAEDSTVGWNGIEFNRALPIFSKGLRDSSKLVECEISYAKASYLSVTSMCGVSYRATSAVRATMYSELLIDRCNLHHNTGVYRGGAVELWLSSAHILRSSITSNSSNWGAGILITSFTFDVSSPLVEQNSISRNGPFDDSTRSAGAGILCECNTKPILMNNVIADNTAAMGSAIYAYYDACPTIVGNLVVHNRAGSAVVLENTTPMIANNTIASNDGYGIEISGSSTATITSNIVWDHKPGELAIGNGCVASVSYCTIEGGEDGVITSGGKITFESIGNSNPHFVSSTNFDLSDSSSSINAGNPFAKAICSLEDILSRARVFGGRIDIGAFENQRVMAPDEVLCMPHRWRANVSSSDSVVVEVLCINNAKVLGVKPAALPLRAAFRGDSSSLVLSVENAPFGGLADTVVIYSSVGNVRVPIDLTIGFAVSGTVSGVWEPDEVFVNGDVLVPASQTLRILPGTRVTFLGHYKLDVQGQLVAEGNEERRIQFCAQDPIIGWKGIRFESIASTDTSRITYCTLTNGRNRGTDLERDGGAICVRNFSRLVIERCIIEGNDAGGYAGGGIYVGNGSSIAIRNNTIRNNTALDGGAVYVTQNSHPSIIGNVIVGNHGNDAGGINVAYNSNPLIANNLLEGNRGAWGGAFRIWSESNPRVYNNTVINNSAEEGGGFFVDYYAQPELVNNIINRNTAARMGPQIRIGNFASPSFYNNLIDNGLDGIGMDSTGVPHFVFSNNIDKDPVYAIANGNDYYLGASSPCRNGGREDIGVSELTCSNDLMGNPRVAEGRIDIGAYEYNPDIINSAGPVSEIPREFTLCQNYPNPFNPSTNIRYGVPKRTHVLLTIYNMVGQKVVELVNGDCEAGYHIARLNASRIASGVYFYRLVAGDFTQTRSLVLVK